MKPFCKESSILVAIMGLSIVGARLQNNYLLYTMLGLICLFVILAVFDKIDKRTYPYALFTIGLALLYQTMLMSNGLVGTDIHTEYHYYWLAMNHGWDPSIAVSYNSCLGTVILTPFLAKTLHIDGIWIFKVIYPFLFAFVPLLLFLIFKKQFGDNVAFLSVFFFLAVPVWSLEMIALPRQMLGELMLVICAYLVIVSNLRLRIRVPLLGACAVLGAMFHYVMGPTILLYLGVSTIILPFFKRRCFPVRWLAIVVGILIISSIGWYGWAASGESLKNLSHIITTQIQKGLPSSTPRSPAVVPKVVEPKEEVSEEVPGEVPKVIETPPILQERGGNIIEQGSPLVKIAFGLDFAGASVLGKVFRVFQFATQILLIAGCLYLFIRRKKYSPESLGFAGASVLLMLACILVPDSVTVIDTSRVYHLVLLFLAPTLVLGGQLIFRNLRILTICLIIPYFLFTSGIIFEAFKCEDVSRADMPYSIALSHDRVDVAAVYTDNDMLVRDWAIEKGYEPMFLDINGVILFAERTAEEDWRRIHTAREGGVKDGITLLPEDPSKMPDKYYIFLREWNIQNGKVTFQPGWYFLPGRTEGMRQSFSFNDIGLDKTLEASKILYRKGDAIIYGND